MKVHNKIKLLTVALAVLLKSQPTFASEQGEPNALANPGAESTQVEAEDAGSDAAEVDAEVARRVIVAREAAAAEKEREIEARVKAILLLDEQQRTEAQRLEAFAQKAREDLNNVNQNVVKRPAEELKRFFRKL
ncbi:MAG: hypothetical protein COY39_03065 [Alphaproteobacteria bacterium CG_4_10_14_0_8_um_filter_37_21]|nr:MAG: hypothetical protein COY39_03065 [Alphaproteobacteria bacterium CG_4_10_14_0_8_um_filter_37_21]